MTDRDTVKLWSSESEQGSFVQKRSGEIGKHMSIEMKLAETWWKKVKFVSEMTIFG